MTTLTSLKTRKNEILQQSEKERCERSYYYFVKQAFKVLEPETEFIANWHIKYLCARLQKEADRIHRKEPKIKDIIINVPPRCMKSFLVTVFLNAWVWTKYSSQKFITASYSSELASKHSVATRTIICSSWYKALWGDLYQLTESRQSDYANSKRGERFAVGFGGSATGRGCDWLIIDDPSNPKGADSDLERETTNSLYTGTFYNRLNSPNIGIRIIVMQRLNSNDLTGFLLKNMSDYYEHICFPFEKLKNIKPAEFADKYENGVLWNGKFPKEIGEIYKKNTPDSVWAGQYGQAPTLEGARIWETSWFKLWLDNEVPINHQGFILSWDTAFKDKAKSDYSSCAIWAILSTGYLLVEIVKKRLKFPDLKATNKFLHDKYRPVTILIEDKASGQSLIDELENGTEIRCPIVPMQPNQNKRLRAELVSPTLKQGKVWYITGDWTKDFFNEVENFPNGEHDDQIDSVSQFLIWSTQMESAGAQLR